LNVLA
jgi:hypothetical protein